MYSGRLEGVVECSGLCGVLLVALSSGALIVGVAACSCLRETSLKRLCVEVFGQIPMGGLIHIITVFDSPGVHQAWTAVHPSQRCTVASHEPSRVAGWP